MKAVSFKPNVFHQWRQLGLEQGLKTDTEIADFLLQQFQSSKDIKHIQPYTCVFCNAPLPSVCTQCGTLAGSHQLTSVDAHDITAVAVITSEAGYDLVMDTGQATAPAAINSFTVADLNNSSLTVQVAKQELDLQVVKKENVSQNFASAPNEGHNASVRQKSENRQQNGFQVSGQKSQSLKKRSEQFQCEHCAANFPRVSSLSRHRRRCHPEKKGAETHSVVAAQNEQMSDEESDPAGDGDCDVEFPHMFENSPPQRKQKGRQTSGGTKSAKCLCQVCGGVYSSKASLKLHMRTHAGVRPYVCPQCHRAFSYSSHLTRHLRVHSGERPYLCTQCGATFTQKNDLNQHMHRHSGLKPFMCNECGKRWSTAGDLRIHMVSHSDQTPFRCQECGASFARESSRVKHMRTHTGEKPYRCCDCGVAYSDSSTLRRHRQRNHQEKASKKTIHAQIQTAA